MPRQPTRVEVLPLEPSEYKDVLEDSSLTSPFEIFLEHGIGKRRVQCDHCGLFTSVTSGGGASDFSSIIETRQEGGSKECKMLAKDAA